MEKHETKNENHLLAPLLGSDYPSTFLCLPFMMYFPKIGYIFREKEEKETSDDAPTGR